jgi:hypothetical protein
LVGQALFRTDALRGIGGFDERLAFGEDQDLWMRIGRFPVAFTRARVLRVRVHEHQSSRIGPDPVEHGYAIRKAFLATLAPPDRTRAECAIQYWLEAWRAHQAYVAGDGPAFRRRTFRALRTYPGLGLSPLMRSGLASRIIKSFLPQSAFLYLRARKAALGHGVASPWVPVVPGREGPR